MKQRITTLLTVLLIGLTLTACGSSEPASAPSVADNDKAAVQEKLDQSENKTETAALSDEDKQNETTEAPDEKPEAQTSDGTNILVAYFSRADENYSVGTIEVGNTQILGEYITSEVGADSFHIETVTPYPAGYDECCDVAKQEQKDNARPQITGSVDMSQYDIVFLGYPIWWSDMPMAVYTFMESYDWSDKVVIPFCTHEGSGLSGTDSHIADTTGAQVLTPIDMRGSTAQALNDDTKQTVRTWLDDLGF